MIPGIQLLIGFIAGLILMFFVRNQAVKVARTAEVEARGLASDAQNAAYAAEDELKNLKNAGVSAIERVENAGAAAAQQLHSAPDSH